MSTRGVFLLAEEIERLRRNTPRGKSIPFPSTNGAQKHENETLLQLQQAGLIKISESLISDLDDDFKEVSPIYRPTKFVRSIVIPNLEKWNEFRDTLSESVKPNSDLHVFRLSKTGKLSLNIDGKKEYAMEENSLRHRLVRELNTGARSHFRETLALAELLGTTEGKIRKSIADIRVMIKKRFQGIEGADFVEGKKNSGYRLGSKIRIFAED